MPVFSDAPVRVQPYFGYRNHNKLVISARALRANKNEFSKGGRWQAMRTMLAQFASREVEDLPVTLEIEHPAIGLVKHTTNTDDEGFAHFEIALDDWPLPDHAAWEVVALRWANRDGDQCVESHVLAPGTNTHLGVISDIDDTIIETGITGGIRSLARNWKRVLAQLPDERLLVPGTDVFYNALGGGALLDQAEQRGKRLPTMTRRPFFYVSSSPWNLFSYLVAFQKSRDLPLGPLMLRDWAFDRETLGSEGHGAHKRASIDTILKTYPDMRFALIGDDTQGDLPAYAAITADYPGRIAAVFIRKAGEIFSPEEIAAKALIEATGVPIWLGEDYAAGQEFLAKAGLTGDEDAAHIIETIDKRDKAES